MKLNLLLADDDITTVNHLQEIIERELAGQFSIFTASDGLMALKRLKETKIHIVISDIRMPGCDGIQLLTTLREYAYGCEIIMLSGYDDYNLIRNAMKSGAWDYLLKPVSIPDLTALLEEVSQGTGADMPETVFFRGFKYICKTGSVKDDADGFCLCTYAAKPVVYPHCCFL